MININDLLIIFLIIFLTNIVQTITGFAGSMLAMPFLLLIMSMSDAKILIVIVGVFWSLWMLVRNFKKVNWKFVWILSLIMSIGIIIGVLLLKIVPIKIVLLIMGLVIISAAIKNLIGKNIDTNNKILEFIFGIFSGIMQGMVLMGGPFLVLVANSYLKDREEYRTTLAVLWLVINFVLLFVYWLQKLYNTKIFLMSAVSAFPLVLAIYVGSLLNKKINNKQFEFLVNILLIVSALSMLVKIF